jgi:hypothetical protein
VSTVDEPFLFTDAASHQPVLVLRLAWPKRARHMSGMACCVAASQWLGAFCVGTSSCQAIITYLPPRRWSVANVVLCELSSALGPRRSWTPSA